MSDVRKAVKANLKYLQLLSAQYPTVRSVCTEITNLRAILNLPKGTEHFLSDLHGEYEAFVHIINNCSGVIREKVDTVFSGRLTERQRTELCTLIYYPTQKLQLVKAAEENMQEWYEITLLQLVDLCKVIATKYTRSKVRKAMPPEYSYIIDELLHADYGAANQSLYYGKIMQCILELGTADDFVIGLASLIKRLAVDRLHIVGDVFDRGARPDRIMDLLMEHHNVDIQWGNHDALWMGAAAGSRVCVASVLASSAGYSNMAVLEQGYGINLRALAMFAEKTYQPAPRFTPRVLPNNEVKEDAVLAGKIHKALAVMMFKLEGQLYLRRPEYEMEGRLLLDKIDFETMAITLEGQTYPLADCDLPTVLPDDPYMLTEEEEEILDDLRDCFLRSKRLQQHIQFLYSKGAMYLLCNQNLIYHGCVPMEEDGSFSQVRLCGKTTSGKALMDHCDKLARTAWSGSGAAREEALDAMWYLWCGKGSPLFGRCGMTTFERRFIEDKSTWTEAQNPYYEHIKAKEPCLRILQDFGLEGDTAHIINGHVPVRASRGESPIKGEGKLIIIDGGFCRAYQPQTGIAGYTLIYNSNNMRLSAHHPFESTRKAIEDNADIHSTSTIFDRLEHRMLVEDTDNGKLLRSQVNDLMLLLAAYREGILKEAVK